MSPAKINDPMKTTLLGLWVLILGAAGNGFAAEKAPTQTKAPAKPSAPFCSFMELPWRYVVGGYAGGTWLNSETAGKRLTAARTEYRVFTLAGEQGLVSGAKPAPDSDVCPDVWMHAVRPEPDPERHAIGVNAPWNPMPRKAVLSKGDPAVVRALLESRGLAKPRVQITQWARVDLAGNGEMVEIFAATYYLDAAELMVPKAGDYSFVGVRRGPAGKARTEVLVGEFYPKTDEQSTPNIHELAGLLDLNGDGVLEIILRSAYYEGGGVQVWEWKEGKWIRAIYLECGV